MAVRYAPEPAALSDAQNDLNTLGLDEALSETLVVDEPVRFSARISCDTLPGPAGFGQVLLVVIPCGRGKIWYREPVRGAIYAAEAYTGTPFRFNRQSAERFDEAWIVLSAKYGLTTPDLCTTEPYEVTFKCRASQGSLNRPNPPPSRPHHRP